MSILDKYYVKKIRKSTWKKWIEKYHYAKRIPQSKYSFGLFETQDTSFEDKLVGVCLYGAGANRQLNDYNNFFKEELSFEVKTIELVRLITIDEHPKNINSFFISQTFSLLPKPILIISYADPNHGHQGYIYQSTNWLYTGLSHKADVYLLNGVEKHSRSIYSMYGTNSLSELKNKGLDIKLIKKEGKHRYFYFLGSKTQKKEMKKKFIYPSFPYPKGCNKNYYIKWEENFSIEDFI